MNNNNDHRMRAILSGLFAFLLCLSFLSLFLCAGTRLGLLSGHNLNNGLEKSDYKNQVFYAFQQGLKEQAQAHEIPEEVLLEAVDRAQFAKDIQAAITASQEGTTVTVDPSAMVSKLEKSLETYLKEEEIGSDQRIETAVEEILAAAEQDYQTYAAFPIDL